MAIHIKEEFSVYNLVMGVQRDSILVNHRRAMSMISYEIENASLIDNARNRIFSSFQVMSKFLPQIERYRRLATIAESVYVFGVPDIQPPYIPNITYVPLKPTDCLAKEWFLVSFGREYASALATQEITNLTDPDEKRVFKGLWTFDLTMVGILNEWLTGAVEARPMTFTHPNLMRQVQLMSGSMGRITQRLANRFDNDPVKGELKQSVVSVEPELDALRASAG